MKQVLQNLRSGETSVTEVPAPAAGSGRLLIRSRRTLISAGTEKMLVEFGQASFIGKARSQPDKVKQVLDKIKTDGLTPTLEAVFSKLDEPMPLGYCNAGVVTEVGTGVTEFQVGDRVISNGPHAEFASVPKLLCAKIPDGVDDDEAAFTVLASIGLQGVRLAMPTLGETVVVYGLGLIGLITVQLLRASGCRVIGIDLNPNRLKMAEAFGAETFDGSSGGDAVSFVTAATQGRGADAVLITASAKTDAIVHEAAGMSRRRGRIVLVGVVGLNLRRDDFYEKELTFQVSCSYGPGRYDTDYEQGGHDYPLGFVRWTEQRNFEAVLAMLDSGRLDFKPLISHHYDIENAGEAYTTVQGGGDALGVVLRYSGEQSAARTVRISEEVASSGQAVVGVLGAGNFAKMTLLPALAKTSARLKYVAARSNGAAPQHLASKFGVEFATTDDQALFGDDQVNAVIITTNHDSHARFCCKSLEAGKHVLVEKPLALNAEALEEVVSAAEAAPDRLLMVGFNRRFSPHAKKARELLAGRGEPIAMTMTMNAGAIPPDVWVHDPVRGGGRIIGEACHYIDLMQYLSGSRVQSVSAHRMGEGPVVRDDKMVITFGFEDGSIGALHYLANGAKSYPKEEIKVFSDERVICIENFRQTVGYGFNGFKKFKTSRQDKGHATQFSTFIDRVASGGDQLIPLDDLVNTTLASFAAVTSAVEGRTINLDREYPSLVGGRDQ